jgi:predicted phosphodiesterase
MGKEESEEKYLQRGKYKIAGGNILIFGDLHLSSMYEGTHKDYLFECYEIMDKIIAIVEKKKPKVIIFMGDLIGVKEHGITDKRFLSRVMMFFSNLFSVTGGNVFSVKGNHDFGDFSDFDFLLSLGYIKNPKFIDYTVGGNLEVRFHFVNYGDEKKPLEIAAEGSNIVLGHCDYYVDGVTTWYTPKKGRTDLKTLNNFCGVDMVISGHIHIPSVEVLYTSLPDGSSVGLFYPGCPTRVAERFDDCWYLVFYYEESESMTNYSAEQFELRKAEEVFYPKEDYSYGEEDSAEVEDGALDEIINEIFESRLAQGDIFGQIDKIPADEDVKTLAKEYLTKAVAEVEKGI